MTARPVLEIRVDLLEWDPSLTTVCPGYEQGRWRAEELARDVFDRHLLTFALSYSDYMTVDHGSAAESLRKAARAVYQTDKYSKRGEFGELILHAIIRDIFDSQPAISKIYFKDSTNDTVKGFDAVHVVEIDDELELWLGEVKFYADLSAAIRDVTAELREHLKADFLRNEFYAICNKLDESWEHAERVAQILHPNTSLDEIFDAVTIPVLLTYDSEAVSKNGSVSAEYIAALASEAESAWKSFRDKCDPSWRIRLRLILLPLLRKASLVEIMQERLKTWQHL